LKAGNEGTRDQGSENRITCERRMIGNDRRFFDVLQSLVDAWCDRRCLGALRFILQAYPMPSGLTDSWGELEIALANVRAFARNELTDPELQTVEEAIRTIRKAMGRY
jgi:hypothetical protein